MAHLSTGGLLAAAGGDCAATVLVGDVSAAAVVVCDAAAAALQVMRPSVMQSRFPRVAYEDCSTGSCPSSDEVSGNM